MLFYVLSKLVRRRKQGVCGHIGVELTFSKAHVAAVAFVGAIPDDHVAIGWIFETERSTRVKVEVAPRSSQFICEVGVVHSLSVIGLLLAVNPGDCEIFPPAASDLAGNDLVIE